nr:DNA helicase UvrD [Candidatus Cloacimonadota bacterium]
KKVTVGVMNRVVQLSDREEYRNNLIPFQSIIPLKEIISEIEGVGPNSKKVNRIYYDLLKNLGSELDILLDLPLEDIKGFDQIYAEAIRRMRNNEIYIQEGFDGKFGQIKVFQENDIKDLKSRDSLFGGFYRLQTPPKRKLINFNLEEFHKLKEKQKKEI